MPIIHVNDSVQWYINKLTSKIVAESGISTDRFHIGKIVMHCFNEDPDFIHQIDAATGESETTGSMLKRSIKCAISLKNIGLQQGDVIALMAPNHLDLAVPFVAAMYLGVIVAPIDKTLGVGELEQCFNTIKPKIVFCQNEKVSEITETTGKLNFKIMIVTFDKGSHANFSDLLDVDEKEIENFMPTDFNAEEAIGVILPTSGSTGPSKYAAVTHQTWMITGPYVWSRFTKFPSPIQSGFIAAPLQWLSSVVHFVMSPIMRYTRIQSSELMTLDHARYLINTYKPSFGAVSTTMMAAFLKPESTPCDLTCFDMLLIGGSALHKELAMEIKKATPKTVVVDAYGMSELGGIAFMGEAPPGSCGKPVGIYEYRLVDTVTKQDIIEANVGGELWIRRGLGMFREYYNNPEMTEAAFAEGIWFQTGDLFRRDENWNYFFIERIKMMLKYKSYQISPVEVESVIRKHPGVLDVAVTSIPDPECGDLPVACVVSRTGHEPTAQDIKDLVKASLSDAKQLRGGVVFMNNLPTTASTKINRRKLRDMVKTMTLQ